MGHTPTTSSSARKQHGIHFTPRSLAMAVAQRLAELCGTSAEDRTLVVADPACGDGALLEALLEELNTRGRAHVRAIGLDLDPRSVEATRKRLEGKTAEIHQGDFLTESTNQATDNLDLFSGGRGGILPTCDVIIANPPYVRTQVLGAAQAQKLAKVHGLTGRVDLAYAFSVNMVHCLRHGGVFAFIVSNKFLTINAGESLRKFLSENTEIVELWDLGDSKLFKAAVLPCVIFGRRREPGSIKSATFRSIYETTQFPDGAGAAEARTEDDALRELASASSTVTLRWKDTNWLIRVGKLAENSRTGTWFLLDEEARAMRVLVDRSRVRRLDELLKVGVGVKTTADEVFIREDWDSLPEEVRPEADLMWPLRLASDLERWLPVPASRLQASILYPYDREAEKRTPIDLDRYPRAKAYLESHRERLERRTYVLEAGRQWFEPWVPQQPRFWTEPRVVLRDIADKPIFALDVDRAIPNGTLYWIRPRYGTDPEVLKAACAIANSKFAMDFYELFLGTRLYGGRRRFMTQSVKEFPLPGSPELIDELARLHDEAVRHARIQEAAELHRLEAEIDRLCRSSLIKP